MSAHRIKFASVDIADIARARVRAHNIEPSDQPTAADAVRALVAMQAQDYRGGLWSVGIRAPGLTEADVEAALRRREIVRTWPMRGTIHLVAADDARWLAALLGPRASQAAAGRRQRLGLDDDSVTRTRKAWEAALAGGKALGRPALFAAMESAGVHSGDQRGPHLLRYFAEQGVLCFGPHEGSQPTYTLLEQWAPSTVTLDRGEALAQLAFRYFRGHGPATLDDFVGWAMLTKTDARAGIAAVSDQLESFDINGVTYWCADRQPATSTGCSLLPGFDEYVLGYKNRSAFMTPAIFEATVPGGNGVFRATVLNDGQVVGLWTVKKLAKKQVVTATWFPDRKKPGSASFRKAVDRYAAFVGLPTEIG